MKPFLPRRVQPPRDSDRDGISALGVGLFLFGVVCIVAILTFGSGG